MLRKASRIRYNKMGNSQSADLSKGIAIGMGTLIVAGIVMYFANRYLKNNWADLQAGPVSTVFGLFANVGRFAVTVLPFAVFVYGFVGDVINSNGVRLSIPSFAALALIMVNSIVGRILALRNGVNLSPQDSSSTVWCAIPGLESLESPYLPNSILSTTVILFYYICWSVELNYNPVGISLTLAGIALLQMVTFVGYCPSYFKPVFGSVNWNLIISIVLGSLVGVITFAIAKSINYNQYKPFSIVIYGDGPMQGQAVENRNKGLGHSSADTPSEVYSATLIDSRGKPVIDALKIA